MNLAVCILLGVAAGFAVAAAVLLSQRKKLNRLEEATYRNAFIRGLDLGAKNHADWITTHEGIPANGFVLECPECSNIQETIIRADAEWCRCHRCGHRMGAPLCDVERDLQF